MSETVECSRCGTPVAPQGDSLPPFCPTCGAQLEAAQVIHQFDAQVDYALPAPPHESKIEILEATNDQLMLSIPAGGKRANSLGCFGIIWLLITGAVTSGFAFAAFQQDGPPWFVFLFLSLFWLIGFFMLGWAIRMKYSRGYLFLAADRAVHQWILFNRKKNTEVALDAESYARLVESYQENDVPVYRIQIEGADGRIKFGTGMNPENKKWYVDTINQFLSFQYGVLDPSGSGTPQRDEFGEVLPETKCPACGQMVEAENSVHCASCGARLDFSDVDEVSAQILEEIAPESLPHDFPLDVSKSPRGEWELWYPIRRLSEIRGLGCLLVFGSLWETFIIVFTGGAFMAPGFMKIVMLLFTIPFHLVGIGLILFGLYGLAGGFRLVLGANQSSAFWGIGPLGYTRRFSTSAITEIKLIEGEALSGFKKRAHNRSSRSRSDGISCILMAAGKRIPVTSGTKENDSRTAAGLIRYCLHDLGHRLQDE